jgi:hypothetical protein
MPSEKIQAASPAAIKDLRQAPERKTRALGGYRQMSSVPLYHGGSWVCILFGYASRQASSPFELVPQTLDTTSVTLIQVPADCAM